MHPSIPFESIRPLPKLPFVPGIMHVMPTALPLPPDQVSQLQLDLYELRNFHADRKGIQHNMADFCKPLPTATHSWGSQVKGCYCGCRSSGFSTERLSEKGLYGQLITLDSHSKLGNDLVQDLRHLHPQEVALLNALKPSVVSPSDAFHARLELSGVGQLASPIQSLWILAQVQFQASQHDLFPYVPDPEEVLAHHCKSLLHERDQLWSQRTIYMAKFEEALNSLHHKVDFCPNASEPEGFSQSILAAVEQIEPTCHSQECVCQPLRTRTKVWRQLCL